jgi:hypothetical protein
MGIPSQELLTDPLRGNRNGGKLMKLVRYVPSVLVVLCLLTVAAVADSKGEVTFSDHVMVSNTQLEPGNYVVRWNGSGPGVQLKFMHDGKEVASVTGKVIEQKNPHESVTTNSGENGSRVLTEIAFSDVKLVLTPDEVSTSQ